MDHITVVKPVRVVRRRVAVRTGRTVEAVSIQRKSYDPRMMRIEQAEEPVLRKRGFLPADSAKTVWNGQYRGYPVQIFFPSEYPAAPLRWYWLKVPRHYHHVIRGNELCVEVLLSNENWCPDITIEVIFEKLDSDPYFRGW